MRRGLQRRKRSLTSEVSATAAVVVRSPALRVAVLQTGAVIAVALAIVLTVIVAP